MAEHINPWKHEFETKSYRFKGLSEEDELELMILSNKSECFMKQENGVFKIDFDKVQEQKDKGEAQRYIQRVDAFVEKVLDNHIISDTFLYFYFPMQVQNELRDFKLSLKKK